MCVCVFVVFNIIRYNNFEEETQKKFDYRMIFPAEVILVLSNTKLGILNI